MHIAGGFYRELCQIPHSDTVQGSGVRAALAINSLLQGCSLHTYISPSDESTLQELSAQGIKLLVEPRPTSIAFSYFHSLSTPYIQPALESLEKLPPIQVDGEAVLRFGFLEGSAVVNAKRAVYDPQTWRNPEIFSKNGSSAQELALVLNELELYHSSGLKSLNLAALQLMEAQGVSVIVAKEGVRGATVYERNGRISKIPAYRSSSVFKIGSGDVFSAIFSYYWAELCKPAPEAADLASRYVSWYCETRSYKFPFLDLMLREAVSAKLDGVVMLEGSTDSIGQRYTMEEARFLLCELGFKVICPQLDSASEQGVPDALLVITEGRKDSEIIASCGSTNIPTIILKEKNRSLIHDRENVIVTEDFATGLYFVAWATEKF